MAAATERNWNQIVIWGVAIIVVLAVLAWWAGVFEQESAMTGDQAPPAATEQSAEPAAPADQPAQTDQPTQSDQPTQTQ